MKIARVTGTETEYLTDLDPFGLLERLCMPHYFALCCMVNSPVPVALLVASVKERRVVIEWICVEPCYRHHGVATELINHVLSKKADGFSVHFMNFKDTGYIHFDDKLYFAGMGFEDQGGRCMEWEVDVKSLVSGKNTGLRPQKAHLTCPVSNMSVHEKNTFDRIGQNVRIKYSLYDPDQAPGLYDREISSVIFDQQKKPAGRILLKSSGSRYYPVQILADTRDEALALILSSAIAIYRQKDKKAKMIFLVSGEIEKALVTNLFSGVGECVSGEEWIYTKK